MAGDDVRFEVHGVPELTRAFDGLVDEVVIVERAGLIPETRFRGMGAEPFTLDTIEMVARQQGLDTDG